MTMREHMREHHARTAEAFVGIGKVLKTAMDSEGEGSPIHTLCKALLSHITPYAEHNLESRKALGESRKAVGMGDDLDALEPLPTGLTVLHPDAPLIRAVARAGSAPLPSASDNPLFAKIFGVDGLEHR